MDVDQVNSTATSNDRGSQSLGGSSSSGSTVSYSNTRKGSVVRPSSSLSTGTMPGVIPMVSTEGLSAEDLITASRATSGQTSGGNSNGASSQGTDIKAGLADLENHVWHEYNEGGPGHHRNNGGGSQRGSSHEHASNTGGGRRMKRSKRKFTRSFSSSSDTSRIRLANPRSEHK